MIHATRISVGAAMLALLSTLHAFAAPQVLEARRTALLELRRAQPGIRVRWPGDQPHPTFVSGALRGADPRDSRAVALDYLRESVALFGLDDPGRDLDIAGAAVKVDADTGYTVVTMQRRLAGYPVHGALVRLHLDPSGAVRTVHGRLEPDLSPLAPSGPVLPPEAVPLLIQAVYSLNAPALLGDAPRLEVFVNDGRPDLVYRVVVALHGEILEVCLDATTGALRSARSMEHSSVKKTLSTGKDPFSIKRTIHTTQVILAGLAIGPFMLEDRTRDAIVRGYDLKGATTWSDKFISDMDGRWIALDDTAEVSGHRNMGTVLDYFAEVHGRDSFDDAGGGVRLGYHAMFEKADGTLYADNAESIGAVLGEAYFRFGDGGGWTDLPITTLDVVGHEFAHAMLEDMGIDSGTDESAALHESVADCFATFIERRHQNALGDWNFQIGEGAFVQPDYKDPTEYFRNLEAPKLVSDPDHIWGFTAGGEEHENSTIPSHAMYLAWKGGTHAFSGGVVPSGGYYAIRKVYYKALSYLLGNPSLDDMRAALITAAEEIYGPTSNAKNAVVAAYDAIGLIDADWNIRDAADNFDVWYSKVSGDATKLTFGDSSKKPFVAHDSVTMENGVSAWQVLAIHDLNAPKITGEIPFRVPEAAPGEEVRLTFKVGFTNLASSLAKSEVTVRFRLKNTTISKVWIKDIAKDGFVDAGELDLTPFAGKVGTLILSVDSTGPFTSSVIFQQLKLVSG